MAKSFFISYTGQDKKWADWIADELKAQEQTVWYQAGNFLAGDSFQTNMERYIEACDIFIAVLSQAYLESDWCRAEWEQANHMVVHGEKERMVPVRITNVSPYGPFRRIALVDLFSHDEEMAKQILINSLFPEESPQQKTAFPGKPAISRAMFPGALPPNNLPERNPHFSGRESQLNEIHTQFKSGGAGCVKQTITGLGGVGKTQTATEYAWRFIDDYKDAVWLVNAETEISAFNDCLAFAKAAGLLPENTDKTEELAPEQLAGLLKSWFTARNSWLFILDNVERNEVILPYTSGMKNGNLLITTRNRELKQGKSVGIDLFTPDEAALFMRERLSENIDLIDSETALEALIGRMNCFPLALEQAGAYMDKTGRNCSDYLALLDTRGTLVTLAAKQSAPTNYNQAVTVTLSLSFDKLSESARQLFNLCTYMSPDSIPLAFFKRQLQGLPDSLQEYMRDDYAQDEIVMELRNYSLVKRDGDCLSMHRLVQEIGRDQVKDSETDWLSICMYAMYADLQGMTDYNSREHREQFEQMAAHGSAISEHAENKYPGDVEKDILKAHLYHLLGYGSELLGRYSQALMWFKKLLAMCETEHGREHLNIVAAYNCLALVCYRQGDYPGALGWCHEVLAIRKEVLGENHPDTATTYSNIAEIYFFQGDYPEALKWNQMAREIQVNVLGEEHMNTAVTYNSIALVYSRQGKFAEALEWGIKAKAIKEKVLGKEHLSTASTYNDLASIYGNKGDYPEALKWLLEASEALKKVLGEEHPDTVTSYNNIAYIYSRQAEYHKALEWGWKALAIREKVLGTEHPNTATTYTNIAYVLRNQGEYAQSLDLYLKALAIQEKTLGKEHPDTAATYNDIAAVYDSQGDCSKALEWYQKALAVNEKVLGGEHPDTVKTRDSIALIHSRQKD